MMFKLKIDKGYTSAELPENVPPINISVNAITLHYRVFDNKTVRAYVGYKEDTILKINVYLWTGKYWKFLKEY